MGRAVPGGRRAPFWWGVGLAALLGALTGLSAFTIHHARGASYLADSPEACVNCHVMRDQYEAWLRSSHGRVATCNDCHSPHTLPEKLLVKGLNGLRHGVAFTLGNFHEPIRITTFNARVVQANCEDCHRTTISLMTGPHADEALACVSCHTGVGHPTRD